MASTRKRSKRRYRPTIKCKKSENKAKQSFKDQCDINKIIKKYTEAGELPRTHGREPVYRDHQNANFTEVQMNIAGAKTLYAELHPSIQEKFESPEDFINGLTDPDRIPEMINKGIVREILPQGSPKPSPQPGGDPTASDSPFHADPEGEAPESSRKENA